MRKNNGSENNSYKDILIDTLEGMYPNYLKKKIIKAMADSGMVVNSKRKSKKIVNLNDVIDVSDLKDEDEKLNHILTYDSEEVLYKYIEEFEFNKSYRNAVFFKFRNFSQDLIPKLLEDKRMVLYKRESDMKDIIEKDNVVPTIKMSDEDVYIKFSYLLEPRIINTDLNKIKYVVLCKFDLENEVLEIRFDKAPAEYRTNKDFYSDIIEKTMSNLNRLLNVNMDNIDFKAIIEYIRTIGDDEICIYAMEMHRNGSKAYLDSMSNAEMTIPILGELKDIISENEELFNSNKETIELKRILDSFIENIEVTSDLPSVKVCWPKTGTKVGVKHDYRDEEYSLFIYYDELVDSKEMMDYVRNYFMQHYKDLNGEI